MTTSWMMAAWLGLGMVDGHDRYSDLLKPGQEWNRPRVIASLGIRAEAGPAYLTLGLGARQPPALCVAPSSNGMLVLSAGYRQVLMDGRLTMLAGPILGHSFATSAGRFGFEAGARYLVQRWTWVEVRALTEVDRWNPTYPGWTWQVRGRSTTLRADWFLSPGAAAAFSLGPVWTRGSETFSHTNTTGIGIAENRVHRSYWFLGAEARAHVGWMSFSRDCSDECCEDDDECEEEDED